MVLYSIQLARLQRLNGDMAAARTATAASIPIFLALVKKDPTNTRWQRELVEAQLEQAAQQRAIGHADVAFETGTGHAAAACTSCASPSRMIGRFCWLSWTRS